MMIIIVLIISSLFNFHCDCFTTIIALPDTQLYTAYHQVILEEQIQWICGCKDPLHIEYVVHVGDLVEHGASDVEWETASFCKECLNDLKIPISIAPGNHDRITQNIKDNNSSNTVADLYSNLNKYFSISDNNNYIVEMVKGKIENHYSLLNSKYEPDLHFLIITLEYNPNATVIEWASRILQKYSDRIGIIVSHYIQHDCSNHTNTKFISLAYNNCNVLMM